MRTIGIRRLKNEATALLNANETLVVERRGTPIGVYIPLAARDRATRAQSLADFGAMLRGFITAHGLTEDELVAALTAPAEPESGDDAPGR